MVAAEKLMCSAYGRPWVKLILGYDIPRDMWTDIFDCLVIEKRFIEAAVEDIKHDL